MHILHEDSTSNCLCNNFSLYAQPSEGFTHSFLGSAQHIVLSPSSASQVANSKRGSLVSYLPDSMQYVDLSCLTKYNRFRLHRKTPLLHILHFKGCYLSHSHAHLLSRSGELAVFWKI